MKYLILLSLLFGCTTPYDHPEPRDLFIECKTMCSPAPVLRAGYLGNLGCECYHHEIYP